MEETKKYNGRYVPRPLDGSVDAYIAHILNGRIFCHLSNCSYSIVLCRDCVCESSTFGGHALGIPIDWFIENGYINKLDVMRVALENKDIG